MTFQGTVDIQGSVQGALAVEYYLVLAGLNIHKYIGSARQISHLIWSLNFRSEDVPNGEFYLRAKIKNKYGEYGSGQRRIYIANVGTTSKTATSDDFVALDMTSEEKQRMLKGIAEELEIPIHESVQSPDEQKKYIFDYCQSHRGECFPERDSDDDGLNDIDEVRYGTNPKSPDSDLDGFIDGDEVKGGFDPVKYSAGDQSDRIAFESPRTSGETKANIYIVKNIELKESYDAETGETKRNLHLTGKGLPNSFVTLYIFSDPIILTVKTDSEGNWTYELDKELENGEHGAYVAITDNTGKITGKSEPIAFVKTAEAVTVIPAASAVNAETTRPVTQHRANRDIFLLIAIMVSALAVALAVIGLVRHKHDNSRVEVS